MQRLSRARACAVVPQSHAISGACALSCASSSAHRAVSVSPCRMTSVRRISTARSQIAMLPEYQQSATELPAGAVLVGAAPGHTATAAKVLALTARLGEIVSSFPAAMRDSFDPMVQRRQLQAAEGCGSLASVLKFAAGQIAGSAQPSITLAHLRSALLCAGMPGSSCLSAAEAGKKALAVAIALQSAAQTPSSPPSAGHESNSTLSAAAARVVIGRLHALACLISLAHPAAVGSSFSPAASASAAPPATAPASASGPAASDFVGLAAHLHEETGRALGSVARCAAGSRTDPRALAALSGAAACAHASALRNVAAAHLAAAAAHAAGDAIPVSAPAGSAAAAPAAAPAAVGSVDPVAALLADAHSALEIALASVSAAIDERQHFRRDTGGNAAVAPVVAMLQRGDTDLALHKAHIQASLAEVTLMSALWSVWTAPEPAPAADTPAAAASSSTLFVLPLDLQDALAAPLRSAAAAAETAVKLFDEVSASAVGAAAPASTSSGSGGTSSASGTASCKRVRWADYGLDVSGGVARPLRLLSLLQMLGRRPVMAEGLLRSALEHGEGDVTWRNPLGQAIAWPAPAGAARYAHLPVLQRAGIGASWLVYGHLMHQWDKREEEGKRALATAAPLLHAAAQLLPAPASASAASAPAASSNANAKPSAAEQRRSFIRSFLVGAAAGTVHVGSASLALEDGLEEAVEAAEAAAAAVA